MVYIASIAWAIGQGGITAPELSDSDSDKDDGDQGSASAGGETNHIIETGIRRPANQDIEDPSSPVQADTILEESSGSTPRTYIYRKFTHLVYQNRS